MSNIAISVVVAIHGVAEYLKKCLSSLAEQDFSYTYEVICVNDTPNDNSPNIIDEFVKQYPNIFKRIDVINKDLSLTRNDGIKVALGEFICFVDGDDFVYPHYLKVLYSLVKDSNLNIGVANYQVLMNGRKKTLLSNRLALNGIKNQNKAIKALLGDIRCRAYAWNKIYRRDFLLSHNLLFKPSKIYIEDILFNYEAFILCDKINFSKEKIYCYVQRDNSLFHEEPSLKLADKFLQSSILIRSLSFIHHLPKKSLRNYFISKHFMLFFLFYIQKIAAPKSKYKDYVKTLKAIYRASDSKTLSQIILPSSK